MFANSPDAGVSIGLPEGGMGESGYFQKAGHLYYTYRK